MLLFVVCWMMFLGLIQTCDLIASEEAIADSTLSKEPSEPFINSLEMTLLGLPGTSLKISAYETRVRDYQAFVTETQRPWKKPEFKQSESHPAVMVSWEDAKAFCYWLTRKEREAGVIGQNQGYRLPTDQEWSLAVGVNEETDPLQIEQSLVFQYPWGEAWPPPPHSGNYAPDLHVDSFAYTSPVGSFQPNELGFYDMGGNVWEWCEDVYNQSADFRVLRGGSWRMRLPNDLLSTNRIGNRPDLKLSVYGFRVVLVSGS
ncbi:MAG: SUMF1/EgtB/PvdO family nonheme iron enzyme [Verrucomicrobiota bacterium]